METVGSTPTSGAIYEVIMVDVNMFCNSVAIATTVIVVVVFLFIGLLQIKVAKDMVM